MNKHESYVSLETAKLLKQAGFDWECNRHYTEGRNILFEKAEKGHVIITRNQSEYPSLYFAPTLEVAQRWLREVKDTIIDINSSYLPKGYGVSYCVHWKEPNKMMKAIEKSETSSFYKMFDTYEEALEAGIKKCLTLILKKNENR